jgi:hypothetical protein
MPLLSKDFLYFFSFSQTLCIYIYIGGFFFSLSLFPFFVLTMNEGMTEGTRVYVWCVSESLSHIYLDSPLKCCDFCSLSSVLLPIDLFRSVLQKSVDWFFFLISIVPGSKGRRSLRRDFTRTLDSRPSVGVHPDPARHYRRSSSLVAPHQGTGGT